MKYAMVQIRPNVTNDGWIVIFDAGDGQDRVSQRKYVPNSCLGFFHFPVRWGGRKGFEALKAAMIERHTEEIEKLRKSLKALEELQMPDAPEIRHDMAAMEDDLKVGGN